MHPTIRIAALTAALGALSPAAFAGQLPIIYFTELGQQAVANNKQPVAVSQVGGVAFQGAFGYDKAMLNDQDPEFLGDSAVGGFIMNFERGASAVSDILLSLVQIPGTKLYFESIRFRLFTKGIGDSNKLFAIDENGNSDSGTEMTSGGSGTWATTVTFPLPVDTTQLRLTAGISPFAVDDLEISVLRVPVTGGNVPEPGSYALVGMALLAAGAAGRRARRS